jgi:hypothetical protein
MVPHWLHALALGCLVLGFACTIFIAIDTMRHPQRMWIMNLVWPVNGLFGTVLTLWLYYRFGRLAARDATRGKPSNGKKATPFPVMVAKGAMHCGAGCTLGDVIAESLALAFPVIAIWAGWKTLFSEKMFAVWIVDYLFAFLLGVAFQYFTIKPMRDLSPMAGIAQAVKADTLSLTAWQVGMYGFMAIAQFVIFRNVFSVRLEPSMPEFWFMMQIAMIAGFLTSYPVNWYLIEAGVKERM